MESRQRWLVAFSLLALYFIWGSTFIGMKIAMESFPPFIMAGLRFSLAGVLLYGVLRLRGVPQPTSRQWRDAGAVGLLLLGVGNVGVAYAEQWIATGSAAMVIATVPLWTVLFAWLWGNRPRMLELCGIALGMLGVLVLHQGAQLQASPVAAAALLLAALAWAFGSVWSRRLDLPSGAMSSAAQMIVAGGVLVVCSLLSGERWPAMPTARASLAVAYLVVFGSFIAYSAYLYLLKTVRPALATSYAFVNPLVAMLLGAALANESVGRVELVAMSVILAGVLLVLMPMAGLSRTEDSARR